MMPDHSQEQASASLPTFPLTLNINGETRSLEIDIRTTLLDLLRERLNKPGTKKGCDHGLCGACTVSVNGERVVSCLTLAASIDGSDVLTIEGLADGAELSSLQQCFLEHDGFQCGYCTPGQISSAHAMLAEHARGDLSMVSFETTREAVLTGQLELTEHEVRERMAGNICRCGAYANIVAAVRAADQRGRA
ncbi:xanthine dehydrogenase YagT iron-sulfur-binding subunit [Bryocella elongata]|uniref:Xanthine dehydrogenase YagT iron-sulfur-binding subunit n=1 Tax=Bryocella elongata TaxID=863522 RepID=A0A1H5T357_9BACT|nr:(2Fe-2S)-binding protein [Bryocella elongata]SEF57205.1 xanthine dehydrogenase YagT iron-sulfur-binding subunit [Bryocella elongata]